MAIKVQELGRVGRKLRNPKHTFQVSHKPFTIQPFMIAPVLPGETMKSLQLQARAVSKPIKNALVGWWLEYYFFYVKIRDLGADEFLQMFVDPSTDLSARHDNTASTVWYHQGSGVNWLRRSYEKVVEHYFRDEGEAWNIATQDSLALAQINGKSVFDSANISAAYLEDDFDVEGSDANSTIQASEVARALTLWEFARGQNLTDMSYEDFLRTYGVRVAPEERNMPELIRYVREWTYPTNTVEPTTGVPSSAVSWAISERADKDRYFKEPGFIVGLTLTRPKVYLGNQAGAAVGLLQDAMSWLPAIMRDDPTTSLKQVTPTGSIFPTGPAGFWLDVRDLFLYGDQYINFALTDLTSNLVALPNTTTAEARYPDTTAIGNLFPGTTKTISQDGVVNLAILGTQVDQTPRGTSLGMRM